MDQKHYDLCLQKYHGKISDSWEELADKLGYPHGEFLRVKFKSERHKRGDDLVKKDGQSNISGFVSEKKETTQIDGNGNITSQKLIQIMESESKSPEKLLALHNFDPTLFNLVNCVNNLWSSTKKNGERLLSLQSKVTVSPKRGAKWSEETLDKLFENFSNKRQILSSIPLPAHIHANGKMLLVGISDLHYGLLSTKHSAGNEYNCQIAEELFLETIGLIKEEIRGKSFEEIVFLHGNDFINFNSTNQSTVGGTLQENDSIWFDVVNKAVELSLRGINELIPLANKIKVVFVPSNHDIESMYGVMRVLSAYYRNCPNIEIDYSPLPYKYHQFGRCLFGFGHDLDKKKYLERFTVDAKELWSSSDKMYLILAHLHQSMIYEKEGFLEVYRLPTLSGLSRWANNKGYTQTERKTQCFIVDEEKGITHTINIVV